MAYSVSRPQKKLKDAVKKRHPNATENEIKQFVHVWNNVFKSSGSEARAFASAWGVLNKSKKLKSSHRETDPEQTKKDVKKWDKKHKVKKPKKKKSALLIYLTKLASDFDDQGMLEEADLVDAIMNGITKDM